MIKAFNDNDEIVNVKATNKGAIKVSLEDENTQTTEERLETTLLANVQTINNESTVINVNKEVTEIDIANYSDEANLTLQVNNKNFIIGSNLTVEFPINQIVNSFSLSSTAETKVQYVIKGLEGE